MRMWRCWIVAAVAGSCVCTEIAVQGSATSTGTPPGLPRDQDLDREVLLRSRWAAQLGWSHDKPTCGDHRTGRQSSVEAGTADASDAACRYLDVGEDSLDPATVSWRHVLCDQEGHVTALCLKEKQLTGSLPPEWGQLSRLEILVMHANDLSGTLPADWRGMRRLRGLYLGRNALKGSLPRAWSALGSLRVLDLRYNGLEGTLPPEWGQLKNLARLDISYNQLKNLTRLDISYNQLKDLTGLDISYNQLNGTLPLEWSHLTKLTKKLRHVVASDSRPADNVKLRHLLASDSRLAGNFNLRHLSSSDSTLSDNAKPRHLLASDSRLLDNVRLLNVTHAEDVTRRCRSHHVPQVLGGLWGSLAALALGGYALSKLDLNPWSTWLKKSLGDQGPFRTNLASLMSASIYWYDWSTDVMVIQVVWAAWPGKLLLVLALLNYVVAAWVMVQYAYRRRPSRTCEETHVLDKARSLQDDLVLWTTAWPLYTAMMPLMDTVALVQSLLHGVRLPFVAIEEVDLEGFQHMRDVVKALPSLLTAALTSAILAVGDSPALGGSVCGQSVFIASIAGSLVLVLLAWCTSLYTCRTCACAKLYGEDRDVHVHVQNCTEKVGIGTHLCGVLTGRTLLAKSREIGHAAASAQHQDPEKGSSSLPFTTHVANQRAARTLELTANAQERGREGNDNKDPAKGKKSGSEWVSRDQDLTKGQKIGSEWVPRGQDPAKGKKTGSEWVPRDQDLTKGQKIGSEWVPRGQDPAKGKKTGSEWVPRDQDLTKGKKTGSEWVPRDQDPAKGAQGGGARVSPDGKGATCQPGTAPVGGSQGHGDSSATPPHLRTNTHTGTPTHSENTNNRSRGYESIAGHAEAGPSVPVEFRGTVKMLLMLKVMVIEIIKLLVKVVVVLGPVAAVVVVEHYSRG